jgi:uncharacterized membrane protein
MRLQAMWIALRSSLWFVPTLIVASLVLIAVGLIEVDTVVSDRVLGRFPRLFGAGAEGTRGMLAAIASAMITVAGVVFSVTIVALSLTASQYTSRVLRNFMRDRSNQVVLGAFVGIYAYCLIVLRTIRGGESEFVPSIAAFGAIVLAFVGIGLLIHFIHHISSAVQATAILRAIRNDSMPAIEHLFPQELGSGEDDEDEARTPPPSTVACNATIQSRRTGYVQSIDGDSIVALARQHHTVIRLLHSVGDFVVTDTPLALCDAECGDQMADRVRRAFTLGDQRTIEQDVQFGIRQVVDIALKALSPSMNDPTTAVMCIDALEALLTQLARRRFPSSLRYSEGRLSVIAPSPGFRELVEGAVDEIRMAATQQPIVIKHLIRALRSLARSSPVSRRPAISTELARISDSIDALTDRYWRETLAAQLREAVSVIGTEGESSLDCEDRSYRPMEEQSARRTSR